MNKRQFYLDALKNGAYLITAWNISCFGLVSEAPDEWKSNPYPYRLVQQTNGYYYVNPENTSELLMITDARAGQPLFARNEYIRLEIGDVPNVTKPVDTCYGNVLANQIMFVYAFGNKFPFITGRFNVDKIEKMIAQRLEDNPTTQDEYQIVEANISELADPTKAPLFVDEYLRFANGTYSLVAYTQLFTPADTRKTMTQPPGVIELRNKLVTENAGRLHDRAVVADIATQLQALDAEYLKGDRGLDFLITDKSKKIVRSRLFLMYGAETGIEEKVTVDLIQKSLTEGWDIEKFPEMNNALRAGSYYRGKLTELGGAAVKEIFRAAGNLAMTVEDCGSTIGLPSHFKSEESERIVGFTAINQDGSLTRITEDNVGEYVNKDIFLRTPQTCVLEHTDYCATCLGERLARNPTGMAMAAVEYGSAFLGIFMSAAHSKGIQTAKLSLKDVLM